MYEKLTRCPNFTRYLSEKLSKFPNFAGIFARKMTEFYMIIAINNIFFSIFFGGGSTCPRFPPSPTPDVLYDGRRPFLLNLGPALRTEQEYRSSQQSVLHFCVRIGCRMCNRYYSSVQLWQNSTIPTSP